MPDKYTPSGLTIPETAEERLQDKLVDAFKTYVGFSKKLAEAFKDEPDVVGLNITDEMEVFLISTILTSL